MKGVFLDYQTLDQQDLDFSALTSTLEDWQLFEQTKANEITDRVQDAHVVVTNKVPLSATTLENAPNLKIILVAATGCDHIDLVAAQKKGITVCNVAGYSTASVIQHTIGFLINMASSIVDYQQLVQTGAWSEAKQFCLQDYPTYELAGKTLGIVGYGSIGKGVAEVAKALGMNVLIAARENDQRQGRVPLMALLPKVDVLSLHCPLTPNTRHLIDAKALASMKRGALLINVARGGLVDEQALAQALLSGHLGGAAVDVLSQEPPPKTHPLLSRPIPRLIITPHVAWATRESRQRLLDEVVQNMKAQLR
ncbi:MAG: 2-hydroxyacid dehydrogenase [Candidatus Berkiella sp.]